MPKENPTVVTAAGGAAVSLLAPPKMNADGAGVSVFSTGFPKVKVGAGVSFSADSDPNVVAPDDVDVAKLPNTDPEVGSLMVHVLLSDTAAVVEGSGLSLFS